MEVYFEITYLLHVFIIYVSLNSTLILLDITLERKQRFLFIILLSLTCFNLFFSFSPLFILIYEGSLFYLFFKRKCLWFTFLYGISKQIYLSFFNRIQPGSQIKEGIFIYSKSSPLLLHTLICFLLFLLYGAYLSHYLDLKKEKVMIKPVLFSYRHALYHCKAFYDTGNRVEYLNKPVVFIKETLIKDPIYIGKVEIKTIHEVSKKKVILLDWIEIEGKRKKYIYACLVKDLDYDMLLNGKN